MYGQPFLSVATWYELFLANFNGTKIAKTATTKKVNFCFVLFFFIKPFLTTKKPSHYHVTGRLKMITHKNRGRKKDFMNDFIYKMNKKLKHWREVRELFVFPGAKNVACFISCLAHHESVYHKRKSKFSFHTFLGIFCSFLSACLACSCIPSCLPFIFDMSVSLLPNCKQLSWGPSIRIQGLRKDV